jgi:transposase
MNKGTYQLMLPLTIEYCIPKDESIQLLRQIIKEIDLQQLYPSYSRHGKNQSTPKQMFKILCYACMNRIYSARGIERACKRDTNFMYLLEGKHAPDHATIVP